MAAVASAPQQHKQPSRKGKKAWRKNVDISEVQEGLAHVRDEEIQGGLIAERPSDELFTLDTTGSKAIQNAYIKDRKPLRADEIIAQRSAVPAIDSRKRTSSNVTDGVIDRNSKRQRKDWVSHKELQRLKEVAKRGGNLDISLSGEHEDAIYDPWTTPEVAEVPPEKDLNYLEKTKPKVAPRTLQHAPISLAANGKPVAAVQKPKAGASYNPVFEDWAELLATEGQKEIEAERQRLVAQEKDDARLARIAQAEAERVEQTDNESAWEGIESEYEDPETLKKKRPERKTPAERNKIKRRKEAERQIRHEKKMAQSRTRAVDIRALAKALERRENTRNQLASQEVGSSDSDDDTALRRRRLGNVPISQKPLEVVLPDELQESLRRLKPEGNIMSERFRNILVQGKLETRKPITQPKKVKRTYTEKWTYKDWKL